MDAFSIIKRGTEEIILEEELKERLSSGKRLRVKFGADPTCPDIHLGHAVVLRKLRQFQELGHLVVFIIGDFTAQIGDPSGMQTTRPPLSAEEVKRNATTYTEQVFKILKRDATEVVYNSEWLSSLSTEELLRLCSKYTVAKMLQRDDFFQRYKKEVPIFLHEFIYPLLQAYDSIVVDADVELGGSDQKFNLLVARHLQHSMNKLPQVIITMPLLEGTDGVRKMSKSLQNHIGITEEAHQMYGKLMSLPDELILKYLKLLTDIEEEKIEEIAKKMGEGKMNPKDAKAFLAKNIVAQFHGEEVASSCEEEFEKVFSKREIPSNIESVSIEEEELLSVLVKTGLCESRTIAKRLIRAGAVKINGRKVFEPKEKILLQKECILQVGKRKFLRLLPKR